jgi:hypothetical protein
VLISLMLALAGGAAPTPAPKLAALDWTAAKVERELVRFFSDEFARALRARGLSVVTSSEVIAVLGAERQRELLGCNEDRASCLAELGSALGCDDLLMVSLAKLGGTWRANVKVLSSRDGSTMAETVLESDSDKGFARELEGAAARVARALGVGPAAELATTTPRRQAWIPAVGGGAVLLAGGVLLGLASWTSHALDAELSSQHAVTDAAVGLAARGKAFQLSGWVGVGAGLAVLGVAGAMFLFGAEVPLQPAVSITPHGASFSLALAWP